MNDDIVARLRGVEGGYNLRNLFHQAADEIERLREQLRLANIDNFNTTAEIERLRSERDEAIIRANAVIREASALITAKIPSGKASAYWNSVDEFRLTEAKTT